MGSSVEELKAFYRQKRFNFLNRGGFSCQDGTEPSGADDKDGACKFLFHSSDDGIDQSCVPE